MLQILQPTDPLSEGTVRFLCGAKEGGDLFRRCFFVKGLRLCRRHRIGDQQHEAEDQRSQDDHLVRFPHVGRLLSRQCIHYTNSEHIVKKNRIDVKYLNLMTGDAFWEYLRVHLFSGQAKKRDVRVCGSGELVIMEKEECCFKMS